MLTRWINTAAIRRAGISAQTQVRVRRTRLRSAITAVALATGLTALASPPTTATAEEIRQARQVAYVTNQSEGTVSVIDVAGNTTVATIPVGNGPTGVAPVPAAPGCTWSTRPATPCR